jgi:hypothetical protein
MMTPAADKYPIAKLLTQARNSLSSRRKSVQVLDLQAVIYWRSMQEETAPKDLSALAGAWEKLEGRLGKLRGKPEPRPASLEEIDQSRRRKSGVCQAGPQRLEPVAMPVEPAQKAS